MSAVCIMLCEVLGGMNDEEERRVLQCEGDEDTQKPSGRRRVMKSVLNRRTDPVL